MKKTWICIAEKHSVMLEGKREIERACFSIESTADPTLEAGYRKPTMEECDAHLHGLKGYNQWNTVAVRPADGQLYHIW